MVYENPIKNEEGEISLQILINLSTKTLTYLTPHRISFLPNK